MPGSASGKMPEPTTWPALPHDGPVMPGLVAVEQRDLIAALGEDEGAARCR